MAHQCFDCGYEIDLEVKIARRDTCNSCGADLHCCMNCKFYDESADVCRENIRNWVRYREQSNFCPHFTFKDSDGSRAEEQADAKARLNALFKDL